MTKPRYVAGRGRMPANHIVDPSILEQIVEQNVNDSYSTDLSEGERSLLARVPEQYRPWVESVVVEQFYLPLREIIWKREETLAQLIAGFLPAEAAQEFRQDGEVNGRTLRETFEISRKHGKYGYHMHKHVNMSFEDAVKGELLGYKNDLINMIKFKWKNGDRCYPLTYYSMMDRLDRKSVV